MMQAPRRFRAQRSRPFGRPSRKAKAGSRGFTLLELLVVLGILALLATFAGPQVMGYIGRAKTETARSQISAISTALELYALDNGGFPPPQVGLQGLVQAPAGATAWRGPYLKRSFGIVDPWGRPYQYRHPGRNTAAEVFTYGRDNAPGGTGEDQDITNW
jgi:general secretion pathway protein G